MSVEDFGAAYVLNINITETQLQNWRVGGGPRYMYNIESYM